ncbi:MAG: hypothetical protein QM504_02270 [Pseudomonadota bacterium]
MTIYDYSSSRSSELTINIFNYKRHVKKIKLFFVNHLVVSQSTDSNLSIQLVTTALFIEMMLQDGKEQ